MKRNPFEKGPERDPHEQKTCPDCGGTGKDKETGETCKRCNGRGWVLTQK